MLRSILLFIHIMSAIGLFSSLTLEAAALGRLRRATDGHSVRAALTDLGDALRLARSAMLVLLVSGAWLAAAYWHWQGSWMRFGLLGLVAIGAIGGLMTGRTARRLARRRDEPMFDTLARAAAPSLRRATLVRTALVIAVNFLMTFKPL